MEADKEYELLEVLNDDMSSTGIYLSRQEVHEKMLLHNEVSLCVINEKNEILLERRNKNKKFNPLKLGLVGGHVTKGETIEQAIKKETFEEIGVEFDQVVLFDKRIEIQPSNRTVKNRFYTFTDKKIDAYQVQEEEVEEVVYMDFNIFIDYIKEDNNETVYNWNQDGEMFMKLKSIIEKRKNYDKY